MLANIVGVVAAAADVVRLGVVEPGEAVVRHVLLRDAQSRSARASTPEERGDTRLVRRPRDVLGLEEVGNGRDVLREGVEGVTVHCRRRNVSVFVRTELVGPV